jgi:hypothetical protein
MSHQTSIASFRSTTAVFAVWAASTALPPAYAHIGYGGRDFGTLNPASTEATISISNVSSSFGWADGTDADWGDSHRGRFFRFTLTEPTSVNITVERNSLGTGPAETFLPAFSLFAGLGHLSPFQGSHDGAALSVQSRPAGTQGSFRALHDWSIGNDPTYNEAGNPASGILHPASLVHFTYIGHAADGTTANFGDAPGILGDGTADGWVTGHFKGLAAGDYSLFVGGANYAGREIETAPFATFGVGVTVGAVIPEPSSSAFALGLASAACLFLRRRSSRRPTA